MKQISHLTKEERIDELIKDISSKFSFLQNNNQTIKSDYLLELVEIIEDRTYYITDSPNFEFNNRFYSVLTYRGDIDNLKKIMKERSNGFFIIYSFISNPFPKNSIYIRGVFIEDKSIQREKIIDELIKNNI